MRRKRAHVASTSCSRHCLSTAEVVMLRKFISTPKWYQDVKVIRARVVGGLIERAIINPHN